MESLLEPTSELAWVLAAQGYDQLREAIYESRFSISNGLLGLRAGRPVRRGERWVVPQRGYLAGLFDMPGPEQPIPALVTAPGWQALCFRAGHSFATPLRRFRIARHSICGGVYCLGCRLIEHPAIAVEVRTLQLLSLSEEAIGLQLIELKIEAGEIEVAVEASRV